MEYERVAAELVRALRGKRSQAAFSRRLGYRSNIVARWENRRCWPTAAGALRMAAKAGIDVRKSLAAFFRIPRPWLNTIDPVTPEGVVALLQDLRSNVAIVDVARESGFSRFSVSRWLKGVAEPKLPEFLALIEVLSLRLLDFLAAFVDPQAMPSIASDWTRISAAREAAFARPWSHAVLRALELEPYRQLPVHRDRWVAERLALDPREVRECLALLERAGQIQRDGKRFSVVDELVVDLRSEAHRLRELKAFWMGVARARLEADQDGLFGFNLFATSETDLAALRELYLEYYQQMRALISRSHRNESVALFSTQLLRLDLPSTHHQRG
jgi:transcriptional regulator with XRE-family HTH domain